MYHVEELPAPRALPTDEALRYALSLAELLRQMHRDGTVCGRLDPRNILWDSHRVTLALTGAETSGAYLAPEQVRGEAPDARSDIFAFGAILYEMLSGRRAFPAQDPEELKRQILESTPAPLDGVPEGIASLVRGCLEKNRNLRWQRMNFILIELKLASASERQAQSVAEWRDKVLSLRSQVAAHGEQLATQQAAQQTAAIELRQSIEQIQETQGTIQESIAALQKGERSHAKIIEGLQVAASQTDELVERVVEAFGMMHKSIVERGDAQVLLVAGSGS
jgi:serine/threonine protein kinase